MSGRRLVSTLSDQLVEVQWPEWSDEQKELNERRTKRHSILIDCVLPWVQSVDRAKSREEDDIIVLNLRAKPAPERTQRVFY